jgi:hypothetical protein
MTYALGHGKHYNRPLYGPMAHPYLVAFRTLAAALEAAPPSEREQRRVRAIAQLAKERGAAFADIIAWALRERAEHSPAVNNRRKQAFCQRGHSLCCGTCRRARQREAQAKRRAG